MEAIYVIQKSLEENHKMLYANFPVSYAQTEDGANEILRDSLPLWKRCYADLKVLGHDHNWLHVTYTDLETGAHMRAVFTVVKVYNMVYAL